MPNPLLQLKNFGQSVWYDNIDRAQLVSGQFQSLLDNDGITGVTANPTIFQKSISSGHAYDEQMTQLIKEGKNTNEIYEAMIIQDIRTVADMLRPIYDRTNMVDGYVSLEVSPDLAHDTDGTIAEVRRFWKMVDRPNLLIKIPATPEGIPAVQAVLTEGINVNITLIFSIQAYRDVLYAEELIGPDTVDTMPLETIENFRDHGRVALTIENNIPQAKAELDMLESVGISYNAVTQQLLDEGVQKFADSFHQLFQGIEEKKKAIQGQQISR